MEYETYVIGDIHGGLKALEQVIDKIGLQENDQMIFLGDYVDGLPQSAQVIDFLIELDATFSCIFIRGNHDFWWQQWLETGHPDPDWLNEGGSSTLLSYQYYDKKQLEKHLHFSRKLQNFHIDDRQNLFIHAGFTSLAGPEKEISPAYLYNDRTLLETAMVFEHLQNFQTYPFPVRLKLFNEIFIGHTPTVKFGSQFPMHAANLWDIDTGVKKNGRLTVLNVKTKHFWQSDPGSILYPDETGN